jgi:ribonuclease HII
MLAIVNGDRDHAVISAASIIAKTTRDAMLVELDGQYPGYGFAHNRGYGTPEHLAALARHGPVLPIAGASRRYTSRLRLLGRRRPCAPPSFGGTQPPDRSSDGR